jgi:hypothetical protein
MRNIIVAGMVAVLLMAGGAYAQQAAYTWTGAGVGSGKCPTYKMEINVSVDGNAVKGLFQQEGRPQRHFEATKDGAGVFKTKAEVGGGGSMDVTGTIKDGASQVLLDGYCKFGGPLTKK